MEVNVQLHAPAALPPGKERGVGPRAVLDAVVKKNSHLLLGIEH